MGCYYCSREVQLIQGGIPRTVCHWSCSRVCRDHGPRCYYCSRIISKLFNIIISRTSIGSKWIVGRCRSLCRMELGVIGHWNKFSSKLHVVCFSRFHAVSQIFHMLIIAFLIVCSHPFNQISVPTLIHSEIEWMDWLIDIDGTVDNVIQLTKTENLI